MTKSQSRKIKELMRVLKSVRLRCLDCSAFNPYEVQKCGMLDCSLYRYRFGTLNISSTKTLRKNLQTQQKTLVESEEAKK